MDDPRRTFDVPQGWPPDESRARAIDRLSNRDIQYRDLRQGMRYLPQKPTLWRRIWRHWPWIVATTLIGGLSAWIAYTAK